LYPSKIFQTVDRMKNVFQMLTILYSIGLFPTQLNAQWVQMNGPESDDIFCIGISGTNVFAGTMGRGLFLTNNYGVSWTSVGYGQIDSLVNCIVVKDKELFAGTLGGGIYRSNDNAETWYPVNSGLTNLRITCLAVIDSILFAGTVEGGAYRSTDNGANWLGLEPGAGRDYISSFAVSGTNIYVGVPYIGNFCSTDKGSTWKPLQSDSMDLGLTCMGSIGPDVLVGTYDGMYVSRDSGATWNKANSGLTYNEVYRLAISGTKAFVGTWGDGVYLSTDGGETWAPVNTGLPSGTLVSALIADSTNLYLGTDGGYGGCWRRPLSEMVTAVNELTDKSIKRFSLEQNYPNPFNPTTTIRYNLSRASRVILKVYNVLGKECATINQGEKPSGSYTVYFNATNLPSGVYFYRLETEGFVETRKFLLLK
jgi:photosystem II stability/assembly factor-like uncharacterized protein